MKGRALTPGQQHVYETVVAYMFDRGLPPTLRELAAALNVSSLNGVSQHLDAIVKKGFLLREPGSHRGLSLPRPSGEEDARRRLRIVADAADEHIVRAALKAADAHLNGASASAAMESGASAAEAVRIRLLASNTPAEALFAAEQAARALLGSAHGENDEEA